MERPAGSKFIYIVFAILIAAAFIPYPQIVAPAWTVTTVSASHSPLQGVTVREVWEQYSLEASSHEEDRLTDSEGTVFFPRGNISLLLWLVR